MTARLEPRFKRVRVRNGIFPSRVPLCGPTSISFTGALRLILCGSNAEFSTGPISYIHVAYAVTQSEINSGCLSSIRLRSYQGIIKSSALRISTVTRKGRLISRIKYIKIQSSTTTHLCILPIQDVYKLHGAIVSSGRLEVEHSGRLLVGRPH